MPVQDDVFMNLEQSAVTPKQYNLRLQIPFVNAIIYLCKSFFITQNKLSTHNIRVMESEMFDPMSISTSITCKYGMREVNGRAFLPYLFIENLNRKKAEWVGL